MPQTSSKKRFRRCQKPSREASGEPTRSHGITLQPRLSLQGHKSPPQDSFGAILGLVLGPFSVSFLGPKTDPNAGPLFDRFWGFVLAPKCVLNRLQGTPKSEQKAQKHAKTSSKWLCVSSSSALRKSYKNTVFYHGFGASKLSKTTRR